MTRDDFRKLLLRALEEAARTAERQLGATVPRSFLIELHDAGRVGHRISIDEAIERLYLGTTLFHRIIDIAVIAVVPEGCVAFVRVSGHAPVEYQQTWSPNDLGPFKQMVPLNIHDYRIVDAGSG